MPNLSAKTIEFAKPAAARDTYISDGNGLNFKIAKNGTKSFCYRYTYGSKRRLMNLGSYPEVTLSVARQRHLEARRQLESGIDPLQVNAANRQSMLASINVAQLTEEWLGRVIQKEYKHPEEVRRMLSADILPSIGRMLLKDVTNRDIALLINKIVDRDAKVQANRVLRTLKKLFAYAVEQSHIKVNPITMTIKGAGGREFSRQRNLSFDEIALFQTELMSSTGSTSWQVRTILWILLLTGQRSGEVCGMQWKHLNLKDGVWIIPAELTKSERTHKVHLAPSVLKRLLEIQAVTGNSPYVFQSDRLKQTSDKSESILTRSVSQALRKFLSRPALKDIEQFTPHDLRRTVASRMADLEVAPHVIEKILNHAMEGVLAVYNRAEFMQERLAAMNLWGQKMDELMVSDAHAN